MNYEEAAETGDLFGTITGLLTGSPTPSMGPTSYGGGMSMYSTPSPESSWLDTIAGPAGNLAGVVSGGLGFDSGLKDLLNEDNSTTKRALGGANAASGAVGFASSFASMFGIEGGFLGGLSSAGGTLGMSADAGLATTWIGGGGAAGAGTALATGGAVLGAGLTGLGAGTYGDEAVKRSGLFHEPKNTENSAPGAAQSLTDVCAEYAVRGGDLAGGGDSVLGQIAGNTIAGTLAIPAAMAAAGATIVDTNRAVYGPAASLLAAPFMGMFD